MSGLAEEEVEQAPWIVWAKRAGIAVLLLAVGAGVVWLGRGLSTPAGPQQRQMAKIRIVPDTPPPPPPPQKEEKRPEPPKDAREARVEQPREPTPQQEPEQLKMEGPGSADGLAGVAAGTVNNEYSGQVIGGGNGGGSRFAWFKGVLQSQIQSALQRNEDLRKNDFRIVVRIWLSADGSVSRSELVGSTGDREVDNRVRTALAQLPPLSERPPEGLPQPVTMRLISRS